MLSLHTGPLREITERWRMGEFRWLTVVGPDAPDGPELLLEPNQHPAAMAYTAALAADGIPAASFPFWTTPAAT